MFNVPGGSLQTMITKYEIGKYLGLDGWLALFIWLQEKAEGETVRILASQAGNIVVCPVKVPLHLGPDDIVWTVSITQVKASAFDEIFNRLPTAETVSVIQEIVVENSHISHCEHILTFLNNLPKRTECK